MKELNIGERVTTGRYTGKILKLDNGTWSVAPLGPECVRSEWSSYIEWGSITKNITAFLFYELYKKGGVTLDDFISFTPNKVKFKPRDLLVHTSGLDKIPNDLTSYLYYSNTKLLAYVEKTAQYSRQGQKYSYSNLGYALLGKIIEEREGISLPDLIDDFLKHSIGCTDAFSLTKAKYFEKLDEGEHLEDYWPHDNYFCGSSGIISPIEDLQLFIEDLVKPCSFFSELFDFVLENDLYVPKGKILKSTGFAFESQNDSYLIGLDGATKKFKNTTIANLHKRKALLINTPLSVKHDDIISKELDHVL